MPKGRAQSDSSPVHLRKKERAIAGSVLKMATGMARALVGAPCHDGDPVSAASTAVHANSASCMPVVPSSCCAVHAERAWQTWRQLSNAMHKPCSAQGRAWSAAQAPSPAAQRLNIHCKLAGSARDPARLGPARDDVVAVEALVLYALVAKELAQPLRRGHRAALAACARTRGSHLSRALWSRCSQGVVA